MTGVEPLRSRRPGGRSARVQEAVYDAVTALMAEGGDELTIPLVATRAGVNPTSVYRRWGDLETLRTEVAVASLTGDDPVPDTGSLRKDLTLYAQFVVTDIVRPERVAFLRALIGSLRDDGSKRTCTANWEQKIGVMLANAEARGETAPPVEQVMDQVVAPLYFAVLFGRADADTRHARELVRRLLPDH